MFALFFIIVNMLAKAPRKTEAIEDRWVDRKIDKQINGNVVERYVDKKIDR